MNFFRYMKDSFWIVLHFFIIVLIINLILISSTVIDKSIIDIIYMNILMFFVSGVFLFVGYVKWKNNYKQLKNSIEKKENIDDLVPKGMKLEQELMKQIVEFKNKEKLKETKELRGNIRGMNDYITKWVHEIKIPISVCELIVDRIEEENNLYDVSEELRQELERIKFLVNQVLYTSRAASYTEDFIIEEISLKDIITNVIKKI